MSVSIAVSARREAARGMVYSFFFLSFFLFFFSLVGRGVGV